MSLSTSSIRRLLALGAAGTLLLGACGDDDTAGDDTTTESTEGTDDTEATDGGDTDETTTTAAGEVTETTVDPTLSDTTGEPVDICALVSGADVSEAVGAEFGEGTPFPAQGSLLGQCDFSSSDPNSPVAIVSVSARPAEEYDATVEFAGNPQPVEGFPGEANATDLGLMVLFDDFMLQVYAVGGSGHDATVEEAVARIVAENV